MNPRSAPSSRSIARCRLACRSTRGTGVPSGICVVNVRLTTIGSGTRNVTDVAFTAADGTTQLPHEIEVWNEAGKSYVWVKAPNITASSSTDLNFRVSVTLRVDFPVSDSS